MANINEKTINVIAALDQSFLKFTDAFYKLTQRQRNMVFEEEVSGERVIWTGIVLDDTFKSRVAIYGGNGVYYGDWSDISNNRDKLQHIFFAQFPATIKSLGIKRGDRIVVEGIITHRGDTHKPMHWKLQLCEVLGKYED